jgi:hypothetical protein
MPESKKRFVVDLPNPSDPEGPWVTYGEYSTREEAIKVLRHHFGADEHGRINPITVLAEEDE